MKKTLQSYFDDNFPKESVFISITEQELEGTHLIVENFPQLIRIYLPKTVKSLKIENCPQMRFINGHEINTLDFNDLKFINENSRNPQRKDNDDPVLIYFFPFFLFLLFLSVLAFLYYKIIKQRKERSKNRSINKLKK